MITGSLARRYARALLEIGESTKTTEVIGREVDALTAAYTASPELATALSNPIISHDRRRLVLEAILARLAVSPTTRRFALLILERERTAYLPAIARELRALTDARVGRVRARVVSAKALSPQTVTEVRALLARITGKTVVLEEKVDPELIGGVVTHVGDQVYDGSIRTQLERMRERIL
jgi:F-type H+-transporting ATPase subunit delta